jgi:hypothetical protein
MQGRVCNCQPTALLSSACNPWSFALFLIDFGAFSDHYGAFQTPKSQPDGI